MSKKNSNFKKIREKVFGSGVSGQGLSGHQKHSKKKNNSRPKI